MNITTQLSMTPSQGQKPAVVALLFYLFAAVALALLMLAGLFAPEWHFVASRDSAGIVIREWVLFMGLAAPLLFAGYYAYGAILTAASIRAEQLSVGHLLLHYGGAAWLVFAAIAYPGLGWDRIDAFLPGLGLMLMGLILPWLNGLLTASTRNRWDPASLMTLTGMFWLGLAGLYVFGSFLGRYGLHLNLGIPPSSLLLLHGLLAIGGGIWLGLLGVSLLTLRLFAVSSASPGRLSIAGYCLTNLVIVVAVTVIISDQPVLLPWLAGLFLLGSTLIIADAGRLAMNSKHGWLNDSAVLALLAALLIGWIFWTVVFIMLWQPELLPSALIPVSDMGVSAWAAVAFLLPLFYSIALKSVPWLVWRIRCLPLLLEYEQPNLAQLIDTRSHWVTLLLLTVGGCYLLTGHWLKNPALVQLGLVCFLVAGLWLLHALLPAISVFLFGIRVVEKKNHQSRGNLI